MWSIMMAHIVFFSSGGHTLTFTVKLKLFSPLRGCTSKIASFVPTDFQKLCLQHHHHCDKRMIKQPQYNCITDQHCEIVNPWSPCVNQFLISWGSHHGVLKGTNKMKKDFTPMQVFCLCNSHCQEETLKAFEAFKNILRSERGFVLGVSRSSCLASSC